MKIVVLFVVLFAAVFIRCQDILEEDAAMNSDIGERSEKEKRGIALNLGGSGMEGYSYFGPTGRGLYRGYPPMTEYGYDGVNYGMGGQNIAAGYNQMPYNPSPYMRGGAYQTPFSNFRLYNYPINPAPLSGAPYGGFNHRFGGIDGLYQQQPYSPY